MRGRGVDLSGPKLDMPRTSGRGSGVERLTVKGA